MRIKSKKTLLLLFLLPGHYFLVLGQMSMTLPPTPEAQGLLKAVNVQVNKSTGIAGISIPLCHAGDGGLTVPVTLSYVCAAIKVQDIASWVGTGWNLSAGGRITRVIADNDDLQKGYCRGQGAQANDLASWWSGGTVKEERKDRHSGDPCSGCLSFDGEPDLFYYEIAGKTGMFVIDYARKAWTIPYSNLKIELQSNDNFLLTDESGTKYYFNLKEYTTQISHSDRAHSGVSGSPYGEKSKIQNYISSWHLTEIRDLYGEQVTFSYQRGNTLSYENNNYSRLDNDPVTDESVYFKTDPYYLQKITSKSGSVEFVSSQTRSDVSEGRRLDEINVYLPSNMRQKSIKFVYSKFNSQRLRLDKIEEVFGETLITIGKYEYYTDYNLPQRNSKDIDHWGYYNGRNNSSWFPEEGASRQPLWPYTRANLLKRAYNNMGGYNEYEYEANNLSNGKLVGGVRIKSIKTDDANGHVLNVAYAYAGGTSFNTYTIYSNQIYNRTLKYSYSTLNLHDVGGSNVYYGEVVEHQPNGSKIISHYTTYADYSDDKSMDHISPSQGSENADISLFPNSSRFWRRGLLKEEIYKNASGVEVKRVQNNYRFSVNLKSRIKGFFEQSFTTLLGYTIGHVIVYDWLSEPILLDSTLVTDQNGFNYTCSFVYDTKYCLPIEETFKYENGDVYKTIMKYAFSYDQRNNPAGYKESNEIDLLFSSGLHCVPVEQVKYRNNKVVGGSLTTYRKHPISQSSFLPVIDKKKTLFSLPIESSAFILSARNSAGQFIHDSHYETQQVFDSYDMRGKVLSWHERDGVQKSVVYSDWESLPIAEIENAGHTGPGFIEISDSVLKTYDGISDVNTQIENTRPVEIRVKTCPSQFVAQRYVLVLDILLQQTLKYRTGWGSTEPDKLYTVSLEPGIYTFKFWILDLVVNDSVPVNGVDFYLITRKISNTATLRCNQVFYTGFEYDVNAISFFEKARTGEKVYKRSLNIDLRNMIPGNYILSYWKSMDNGNTWEYIHAPLIITSSSLNYTIGSSSFLIDEVRLIPENAFLTSCTYATGVGKTSEMDSNGLVTYYEYDRLGRLVRVLDNERKLVKDYEYFVNFK